LFLQWLTEIWLDQLVRLGRNTSHFPVVKLFENSSGQNFNRHIRPDNILVNRVKKSVKRMKEMLRYLIHSSLDRLGLKPLFNAH
jgi:hypothetical protein